MTDLERELAAETRESDLYEVIEGDRIRCLACGHRCPIAEGFSGVCRVRFNRGGKLFAPFGYLSGIHCDPIEKKPFFHVRPGSRALSFGMLGCSFHCAYCQNWVTSQALRDKESSVDFRPIEAHRIAELAFAANADSVVSTYNEPLITAEWAVEVFKEAKKAALMTGFVSNGSATPEVLRYLRPWLDLFKVDLKSFDDRHYRDLGGRLQPVLDSIGWIHEMGFWLEVVTLIAPGFNDSEDELRAMARFLAGVSPDIPWHVTAFHPDYRMVSTGPTSATTLLRAAKIGREAGLRYVYAGNLPGKLEHLEDTQCHGCGETLVERVGFHVRATHMLRDGVCPYCGARTPGIWC